MVSGIHLDAALLHHSITLVTVICLKTAYTKYLFITAIFVALGSSSQNGTLCILAISMTCMIRPAMPAATGVAVDVPDLCTRFATSSSLEGHNAETELPSVAKFRPGLGVGVLEYRLPSPEVA